MQKCRPQSFFQTNSTALHHALWLGWITPESNISHKCVWTSSTNSRKICLNHPLNRKSSVTLITCLVEWVQLSSLVSKEKMLWYSAKRDWTESTSYKWPGFQSAQILLLEQFFLSLLHNQLFHLESGDMQYYFSLLWQCSFAIVHLSVSVLHCQTLG